MDSEPRPEAGVRENDGRSERPKRDEPCRAGADRKWGTVVVGQLWLADARGQFRGYRSFSRPSAAPLAALKGSETRIRSRDRRPSFARTTAGASGPGYGRALGRESLAHWTVAAARSRGSEADSLIQLREQIDEQGDRPPCAQTPGSAYQILVSREVPDGIRGGGNNPTSGR